MKKFKHLRKPIDSDVLERLMKATTGYGVLRDWCIKNKLEKSMVQQAVFHKKATEPNIKKLVRALSKT